MRARIIFALALLAALLPFAGCSFVANFVVINESDAPVEVRYTLDGPTPLEFVSVDPRPAVKAAGDAEDYDVHWRVLSAGEVAYDPATATVTVMLPPSQALWVAQEPDYGRKFAGGGIGLRAISVSGAQGSVSYAGGQAEYHFVKKGKGIYALTYRGGRE